jgi:hypothetical protein
VIVQLFVLLKPRHDLKKLAIVGDYSKYTSKPLKDFIYESNNGNSIYFVPSVEEALLKLDSAE